MQRNQKKTCPIVIKIESIYSTNLMLMGKVKQAIKLFDADSEVTSVHELTERMKKALEAKHPDSEEADKSVMLGDKELRVEM